MNPNKIKSDIDMGKDVMPWRLTLEEKQSFLEIYGISISMYIRNKIDLDMINSDIAKNPI